MDRHLAAGYSTGSLYIGENMGKSRPPKDRQMPNKRQLPTPSTGWQPITVKPVRVLVSCKSGVWIGQCLEHDVAVQSDTVEGLSETLTHVLVTQCILDQSRGVAMLSRLKEAGPQYWAAWTSALPIMVPSKEVQVACIDQPAHVDLAFKLIDEKKAA